MPNQGRGPYTDFSAAGTMQNFRDKSGNIIAQIDSENRKFYIPSGSTLEVDGTFDIDVGGTFDGDVTIANGAGLVVGATVQRTISDGGGSSNVIPELQVLGTGQADSTFLIGQWNTTNTAAPMMAFLKSGNAAIGSNTVVADNEVLGKLTWFGDDGTDYESAAAEIRAVVSGTPGTGDMPGSLEFLTTVDGGEVLTLGLRIDATQRVFLGEGTESALTGTVSTGDGATSSVPSTQIKGNDQATGSLLLAASVASNTAAPVLAFLKNGASTLGSNTIVVDDEILGKITWFAADGVDFKSPAAEIRGVVNGTPGAGDMPGSIEFYTTVDAGETLTLAMTIDAAQNTSTWGGLNANGNIWVGIASGLTGKVSFRGTTSGTVAVTTADAAGSWTLQLPADDGDAGEQLQTNGSGVTTWETAGSSRAYKQDIVEVEDPSVGLKRILDTPFYEWTYREQGTKEEGTRIKTTGDRETRYLSPMAEDAGWAMHYDGTVFNPMSAFGNAALAIKALSTNLDEEKAAVAEANKLLADNERKSNRDIARLRKDIKDLKSDFEELINA